MSQWLKGLLTGGVAAAVVTLVVTGALRGASQTEGAAFTRMQDGKPNLNGIWAASNTANWNVETHQATQGPVAALGAAFSVPAGLGVVEGGAIPYKPEAMAQRDANARNWMADDPVPITATRLPVKSTGSFGQCAVWYTSPANVERPGKSSIVSDGSSREP